MAVRPEEPQRLTPELLTHAAGSGPVYSLDLSKKGLTFLCSFRAFPKLQSLNLAYNRLTTLDPEGLFEGSKDLKELRLTDNSLESLSQLRSLGLLCLYADFNLISSVEDLSTLKVAAM